VAVAAEEDHQAVAVEEEDNFSTVSKPKII